jgi:hypothetical protein
MIVRDGHGFVCSMTSCVMSLIVVHLLHDLGILGIDRNTSAYRGGDCANT